MSFDDYMGQETGAAEELPPARDVEVAQQEAQLAGLEEVEHAAVASGMYDVDATTTDLGSLTRKVLAKLSTTLPKVRPVLKHAAARRVAMNAMSRVQHPNKMVPMSQPAMAPGDEVEFEYKSPDPAVFMGIVMTPSVIVNFGCQKLQLGSYRALDGSQMSGGQGSNSVGSLAMFSPDARQIIRLGRNRILGGEALFTLRVRCMVPVNLQADFLATLLLYVRNSGC
jgi:hypothetical protein